MWWFSRPFKKRAPALLVLLGLGLSGLAACGFQPMYGDQRGAPLSEDLGRVHIEPIADRLGQQLRNMLSDRLTPRGARGDPAYYLSVDLERSIAELGIRRDATATRANLTLTAHYRLSAPPQPEGDGTRPVLTSGMVRTVVSFNILQNQYATVIAEQDAEERAARQVAELLRTRIGVYLSGRQQADGTVPVR